MKVNDVILNLKDGKKYKLFQEENVELKGTIAHLFRMVCIDPEGNFEVDKLHLDKTYDISCKRFPVIDFNFPNY